MLAAVEHRRTGVAGFAPIDFEMVSTAFAVAYVAAYTAQSHRKEAENMKEMGPCRIEMSLSPIAFHKPFLPAALSVMASSMTATRGAAVMAAPAPAARPS